jgi:hypothetical protein
MKNSLLFAFILLILFSCTEGDKKKEEAPMPENGMDAARKFLRAALDGDYKTVRSYSVNDSTNKQLLDISEWKYKNDVSPSDKNAYKSASIRFLKESHPVNDSVTIVHYSNSFKNYHDSLKVIRTGNKWLIDLNFTFQKNDSLPK